MKEIERQRIFGDYIVDPCHVKGWPLMHGVTITSRNQISVDMDKCYTTCQTPSSLWIGERDLIPKLRREFLPLVNQVNKGTILSLDSTLIYSLVIKQRQRMGRDLSSDFLDAAELVTGVDSLLSISVNNYGRTDFNHCFLALVK
jgi:hypothetical protein